MVIASMDLRPISKLDFVDLLGQSIAEPEEWTPAFLKLDLPVEDWESARLTCNGRELPVFVQRISGSASVLTSWPRSTTGNYAVHLHAPGIDEHRVITIWPSKLNRSAYASLLEDLDSRLPTAIALNLQRLGALGGMENLPVGFNTLAQELVRLRRAVVGIEGRPGLERVLNALADEPYQILDGVELWVRRGQARRPHPARLVQSLTRTDNLDSELRPRRVIDARVEHSVDVYENRMLKSYFQQVQQRLRRLIRLLTASQHADLLDGNEGANDLIDRLTRARARAAFLDHVSLPAHLPTRITMVLLNHAAYRAALDGFLEFRREVTVRLDDARLDASLENLPALYQAWGTLQILDVVLDVGARLGYVVQSHDIVKGDAEGLYVHNLAGGRPIAVLGHLASNMTVTVTPERTFARNGLLHSVSFPQRPDVSLEVGRPGQPDRVYLFDPKYKLDGELIDDETVNDDLSEAELSWGQSIVSNRANPRPKKIDIDKMHAYRDAIRDVSGNRAVEYAGILYPGPTQRFGFGIEALAAVPGDDASLLSDLDDVILKAMTPYE